MEAHIPGIGVENFRIFEKEHYFNFAPITLLTGANSSGKSSLIKALKFMKDTYKHKDLSEIGIESQYKVGDLEKLFIQQKFLDLRELPVEKHIGYLNRNGEQKNCTVFTIKQTIPLFGNDILFSDRKSTRLNSSHRNTSRMPSSA